MIYNTNYLTKFVQNLFTITRPTIFYTSIPSKLDKTSGVGKKENKTFIEGKGKNSERKNNEYHMPATCGHDGYAGIWI